MTATTASPFTPDFSAIKSKQNAAWSSGDYAKIGTTLQIVGESLAERMDVKPGSAVLDVAAGNGNATLAFARRWDRAAPLLIHCWAGISRSTAAAYIAACAFAPERDEAELAARLRKASPSATPNARLVAIADAMLGRDGRMRDAIAGITPERASGPTGIDASTIRRLARDLAAAPSAAVYGRIGLCTQEFGTLASWLVVVLNVITGNLDRPGGAMFPTPLATSLTSFKPPQGFTFGTWRSRVRGAPEVLGQVPAACLAALGAGLEDPVVAAYLLSPDRERDTDRPDTFKLLDVAGVPHAAVTQAVCMVDDNFGFNPLLGAARQKFALRLIANRGDLPRLVAWYGR